MQLPVQQPKTVCPYCERPISLFNGSTECPHCAHPITGVACPRCSRPTLNLTLISRYGKTTCFSCGTEYDRLPLRTPETAAQTEAANISPSHSIEQSSRDAVAPRTPKHPSLPSAAEARAVIENCLVGLERSAQDREMLFAPDLRTVVSRFLDTIHETVQLDSAMNNGNLTSQWLLVPANLERVVRLCFSPLWPTEAALLPASVQAWTLVVDDAARRWQYARRNWLDEECGLTMMPIIAGITTANPIWQEVVGDSSVVSEVIAPGFLLHGEVIRKAKVLAN